MSSPWSLKLGLPTGGSAETSFSFLAIVSSNSKFDLQDMQGKDMTGSKLYHPSWMTTVLHKHSGLSVPGKKPPKDLNSVL